MPAALCLSIDVELAWGIWDRPSAEYHQLCADKERPIVAALLAMLARHDIRATWAVVGRLLERGDTPTSGGRHGERIWYAPDVVEAIRAAAPRHDIGSHGFAHVYFDELDPEQAERDVMAARRVHREHGLDFASFVFPRNQIAHLELLRASAIKVYRSVDRGWHIGVRQRAGRSAGRIAHLVDAMLPIAPTVVWPQRHASGLVELPGSMLLMGRNGARRLTHPRIVVQKARRGLDAARARDGIFHLWFHPSNFYYDTQRQLDVFDAILRSAAAMRERGEISVRTMSDFA